jgi:hypothetical protein
VRTNALVGLIHDGRLFEKSDTDTLVKASLRDSQPPFILARHSPDRNFERF